MAVLSLTWITWFKVKRLLAAFFLAALCTFANCVNQIFLEMYFHDGMPNKEPLPDLGFLILPDLSKHHLADYFNIAAVILVFSYVIFISKETFIIIRRFMVVHSLVYLLRSMCIIVTVLPPVSQSCQPKKTGKEQDLFIEAFKILALQRVTCYDTIFSGHTSNLTMLAMFFQRYVEPQRSRVFRILAGTLMWLWVIAGYLIIIATRFHYTVDVLLGYLITRHVFKAYHYIIRIPEVRDKIPLMAWYEAEEEEHSGKKNDEEEFREMTRSRSNDNKI